MARRKVALKVFSFYTAAIVLYNGPTTIEHIHMHTSWFSQWLQGEHSLPHSCRWL